MDLVTKHKPHFATLFTNHVASNMHRFWEASFPEDCANSRNNKNGLKIYMKRYCYGINCILREFIIEYIKKDPNRELWIVSSMGQSSVENYEPTNFSGK